MKLKKELLVVLMTLSPAAFAQYAATVGDLNTIFNPPMNIQGIICQGQTNTGNEHSYKACSDGVASARYMAEKYATAAGKYMGCVDGTYQGIWDGFMAGKNPTAAMLAEAQEFLKGAVMQSAVSRALTKASSEAQTESADQIISRYRKVIGVTDAQGRQVLPDKSYKYPTVTFMGFEDGYEYDLNQGTISQMDFSGPTRAGWINASTSFENRVAAAKIYALSPQYATSLCDVQKTIFGRRSMPQLTLWDFFKAQRDYDFQNYGWNNGNWTWDYFVNDERNLDLYQNYNGIANLEKTIIVKVPVVQKQEQIKRDAQGNPIQKKNPDGTPMVNAQGQPVYETEMVDVVVGYKDETKRVKLDANDVKELQAIYRKGFIDSYNSYFARQYASLEYNKEGIEKYGSTKLVGQLIGEEVARNVAKRNAYNGVYKVNSASKYAEEIKRLYKVSFDRLIGIFENNPVVDLNEAFVVGQVDDDIFRPGEDLSVQFDVTNLGEKTRPIMMNLASSADVIATNSFSFTPAPLERVQGQTNVLAKITNDRQARETIQTNFVVKNPSDLAEIKSSLRTAKSQSLLLADYAEINKIDASIDPINGNLSLQVQLVNPSKMESPAFPTVELILNGDSGIALQRNVDKVAPKGSLLVGLSTDKIDPIELIRTRTVSGLVQVKLAGRVVHKTNFVSKVNASFETLLAKYFHALVVGKVRNTGNESAQDRIEKLIEMINASVDRVLSEEKVKWKRQSEVDSTVIGDLQKNFAIAQASGELTETAKDSYKQLAELLAKKVNNRGSSRIRGFDKHYLKALQKFDPSLSTKPRHHK